MNNMINKGLKRLSQLFAIGFASSLLPAYAIDGHAGLDLSLANNVGKFGLYSLRETPTEITNLSTNLLFTSNDDRMIDVMGVLTRKGMLYNNNLELGLKAKLYYLDQNSTGRNSYGLMLGGIARYWLPTSVPTAISADYLYSPNIVTAGDGQSTTEYGFRAELRILPSAIAYVGYRKILADFGLPGSYKVDGNPHVGVTISFDGY